ncbi:hypothetical protein Tco_1488927 [Tanacetum coccineum]
MSDLKFADTHQLLRSSGGDSGPDVSFDKGKLWVVITVKAKTVNEEVQLQALVDKKKVIITESIIRRDLQLEDANGSVDCLPNAAIFE